MNIIKNFLQCIGVVSMGIGIWLYVTKNEYATLTDGKYLLGSAFLIAVGFGVIIVGFLGIVAALWESNIVASFVSYLTIEGTFKPLIRVVYNTVNIGEVFNIPLCQIQ